MAAAGDRAPRPATTGEAYEVEVRKADGTEVDVTLDKNLKVVSQDGDDRDDCDDDDPTPTTAP